MDSLNRFYLLQFDVGHEEFLKVAGQGGRNEFTLHEVVLGMIEYSSNCNTEYLQHVLGMEQIEKLLKYVGLHQEDNLYLVSYLLCFLDKPLQEVDREYVRLKSQEMHDKLINREINPIL